MIHVSDPRAEYQALKGSIDDAIGRVLDGGRYILGQEVEGFEREFGAWLGGGHCVGCASGTDALVLALRALGVGAGDQVATVSHTAVATVVAIELCGAEPVLLDVDPKRYTLDPSALANLLAGGKGRLKAVIAVHLYGQMADLTAIRPLCDKFGLFLVEDCAQAHGARLVDRVAGSWGDAGCFSFYPTKNLGAFGDAGAVVFADPRIADEARMLRQYGWRRRYVSERPGINSRLDELQAAILRVKLPHLHAFNSRRRRIASIYDGAVKGLGWESPSVAPAAEHVYHQYVVRVRRRDALAEYLKSKEVESVVLYPEPIHLQKAYRDRFILGLGGLPNTEALVKEIVSLPIHPHLLDADIDRICAAVRCFN